MELSTTAVRFALLCAFLLPFFMKYKLASNKMAVVELRIA